MLKRLLATAVALGLASAVAPRAGADIVRDKEQWVLAAVDAQRAWQLSRGAGVTVAVVDTGVKPDVPDLNGSVTSGPDYISELAPNPVQLHGTYMASLIAGHGHGSGGADGVIGIAPQARLLSVRVIADKEQPGYPAFTHNYTYGSAVAKGVRYAADHGADVINLSLGGDSAGFLLREAVTYAISRGVMVVAAAGNDGTSKKADKNGLVPFSYPGGLPGVLCVAALTSSGAAANFSDRNASVMVGAPGANVVGAATQADAYLVGDGTSQATAIVSGVAALIRSKYPRLMPALVSRAITSTARNRPTAGYSDVVGFGEVDAAAALVAAGNLAHYTDSGAGKTATTRFTAADPKPVQVILHPPGLVILGGWLGIAALFGFLGAVAVAIMWVRGRRAD